MKKISIIVLILLVSMLFNGCSSNDRLTDMTVIQAIGIDSSDGDVKVTIQFLDINKGTGTNEGVKGNITALVNGSGSSISAALSNAEKKLSDKLFFGQTKLIVLSGDAEKALSGELKSFLSDSTKIRPDILVVKSKTEAGDIIKNKQRDCRVPAENICKQLIREKKAFTINDYLNSLKENNLPVIEAKDDYTVVSE